MIGEGAQIHGRFSPHTGSRSEAPMRQLHAAAAQLRWWTPVRSIKLLTQRPLLDCSQRNQLHAAEAQAGRPHRQTTRPRTAGPIEEQPPNPARSGQIS